MAMERSKTGNYVFLLCIVSILSLSVFGIEVEYDHYSAALTSAGNYGWWYGCSPTSAGMLLGTYDRIGYKGHSFENLVPGGVAEQNTFGNANALVNRIIASPGHVSDFYRGGYKASGDDALQPWHDFDCLADFMGTSQDSGGNINGSTSFYYFTDNSPFTADDALHYNIFDDSGMYGIGEYLEYAGYGYSTLYNQRIYGHNGISKGFTFDQYKLEIDSGRGVLIHVTGHTMYGYGYIDGTDTILFYDTWNPNGQNPGTMAWGGAYYSLDHTGVTVLNLLPEPTTMVMLLMGSLVTLRKRS